MSHDISIYFAIHVVTLDDNGYRAAQLVFIEKLCESNRVKLHAMQRLSLCLAICSLFINEFEH